MAQQILPNGTTLGNRFEIEQLAGPSDLGSVYKAVDTKTRKPVALRVIPRSQLPSEAEIEDLRERVREASNLTHRNIRASYGMGLHEESIFIASEWVDGQDLRTLLDKRKEEGKKFSFKGAYNIIGHVCNALSYAHPKMYHASLAPQSIMINDAGRVKVCDFGLSVSRTRIKDFPGRTKSYAAFWAPEILDGRVLEEPYRADIFSLGALFYELITGIPPTRPLKAPSLLGFSKEVDQVIAGCMGPNPAERFKDADAVKAAIQKLVDTEEVTEEARPSVDDNLGIDVDVDLSDMDDSEPPFAQTNGGGSMLDALGLPPAPNQNGQRNSGGLSMLDAPGLPPLPNNPAPRDRAVSTINMGELLNNLTSSEAARWMVQKDKFDHGPFTDRELIQMILLGEVLGKHQLLNMDTGVRKKVRNWGEYDAYLERYRLKKKDKEEREALVRTEKAETRGTIGAWLIVLIVIGVIGLAAGGYFLTRSLRKERTYTPEEMLAALDSGEIKLKSGGNLINSAASRGKGGRRRGGGGGGGGNFGGGMSYEEAMNMGVEIGNLGDSGGQKQLSPEVITSIMDRNVRRFLPCMAGQNIKKVAMDIVIQGDGRVMGISVNQGGSDLQRCVSSVVRSIKFPTSPSPRTAASWYFELY